MTLGPQFRLFHGSGADLRPGDLVEPRNGKSYASEDIFWARKHASLAHHKAPYGQMSLFGTVYEVEPMGDVEKGTHEVRSSDGFRVNKVREYVPGDFYWKPRVLQ